MLAHTHHQLVLLFDFFNLESFWKLRESKLVVVELVNRFTVVRILVLVRPYVLSWFWVGSVQNPGGACSVYACSGTTCMLSLCPSVIITPEAFDPCHRFDLFHRAPASTQRVVGHFSLASTCDYDFGDYVNRRADTMSRTMSLPQVIFADRMVMRVSQHPIPRAWKLSIGTSSFRMEHPVEDFDNMKSG